jgi:hypothetical protein
LVGTVTVIAEALERVTNFPLSVRTGVYVVPVCGLRVKLIADVPMVAPLITGLVKVLLVKVSVVSFPTKVSVAAGKVKVVVPAIAVACNVVVPDVDPLNPNVDTGEDPLRKKIKSDDVSTCFMDAPAVCDRPDTPAVPVPA